MTRDEDKTTGTVIAICLISVSIVVLLALTLFGCKPEDSPGLNKRYHDSGSKTGKPTGKVLKKRPASGGKELFIPGWGWIWVTNREAVNCDLGDRYPNCLY